MDVVVEVLDFFQEVFQFSDDDAKMKDCCLFTIACLLRSRSGQHVLMQMMVNWVESRSTQQQQEVQQRILELVQQLDCERPI